MPANTAVISVDEYVDQIAAGWPPLTGEGKAALARVLIPVVRELAAEKQRRTKRRRAA